MEKVQLQQYIDSGLSQRGIAATVGCSQASIRYWLKRYDLFTKGSTEIKPYLCGQCGETNPDKFYVRRKILCKSCENSRTLLKGREMRNKAIAYLGGKCVACGFDEWNCSLAIHHRGAKDPNFASMRYWKWDRVLREIEDCVVLCHNCHSGHHAGFISID